MNNTGYITLTALLALVITVAMAGDALAQDKRFHGKGHPQRLQYERGVTPYGDFCSRCSIYGVGHGRVARDKAIHAIRLYFSEKGLTIGNVRGRKRFLKVDIFRGESLVDTILFDRKTGRIRSIY